MALSDFIVTKEKGIVYELKSKKPNYTINDLVLEESVLEQFQLCINKVKYYDKLYHDWELSKIDKRPNGVVINFYGPPGTGKTISAEAIANLFNKNIIEVNYSDIYSELMGKSSKNLQNIFNIAKQEDAVLFFDEADSILSKRSNHSNSSDQDNNLTKSIMLKLLDSHDGIVIFATNYFDNYDPAFFRRILAHIEFKMPDEDTRKQILFHMLSNKVPGRTSLDFNELSKESNGLTGGEIKNVIIQTLSKVIEIGYLTQSDLIQSIKQTKNSKGIPEEYIVEGEERERILAQN